MATTQANLLIGFSKVIGDYYSSTTTSAGAVGGTTVIDTGLTPSPNDALNNRWVRLPATVTEAGKNRLVNDFVQSTGTLTVTPAYAAQVGSGVAYQLHRIAPALKLEALNDARVKAFGRLFVEAEDISLTVISGQYEYTVPAALGVLRQVWMQQQTTPADYPYKLLSIGEEWDLRDTLAARTLRLPVDVAAGYVGKKIRLVAVKPLSSVAVDTDNIELTDEDDLHLLYVVAAALLYDRLRSVAGAQDRGYYEQEFWRWAMEAEAVFANYRRAWPLSL